MKKEVKIKSQSVEVKIITHLVNNGYNVNQSEDKSFIYVVYTPYNKRFLVSFYDNYMVFTECHDFHKMAIGGKKMLKLLNKLNNDSITMKFDLDYQNILTISTRQQKVYNKSCFQSLLNDIEYDICFVFMDEISKYLVEAN